MTIYYIDFDTGNDSNSGTSTSTPWKHCPGDSNFTGSHSVIAGDTFIFKGGVVYEGQVTITASGTSSNYITFDGNSLGTWGTGKAIIDGCRETLFENAYQYGFYADYASNTSGYLIFNNFEIRNVRTVYQDNKSKGIFVSDASHVEIKNCYLHNIFPTPTAILKGGDRNTGKSGTFLTSTTFKDSAVNFSSYASAGGSIGYYKIVVGWGTDDYNSAYGYVGPLSGDNNTFIVYTDINRTTTGWNSYYNPVGYDNGYFYWIFDTRESHYDFDSSVGLDFYRCTDISVHDNVIKECRTCVGFTWYEACSNITVYNNDISSCCWGVLAAGTNSTYLTGLSIHNNEIHDFTPYNYEAWGWHSDGIMMFGWGTTEPLIALYQVNIYNNVFYGDFSIANTAMIYAAGNCDEIKIWNNVFKELNSGGFCIHSAYPNSNLYILNNTFYDSITTRGIRILQNSTATRMHNNLFYGFNSYIGFFSLEHSTSTLTSSSHNLFYYSNMNLTDERMEAEAVHYTVGQWLASQWGAGCLTDNPIFVSSSDVHLQQDSPARGAGVDLSSMIPSLDADGVTRSNWSIGAYEYVPDSINYLALSTIGGYLSLEVVL